jgi:hypothetical protein
VFANLIKSFKPTTKNIFLYVAQGLQNNNRAFMFYNKLGFVSLSDDNPNIMIYTYKGGAKIKRKYKRHYTNKHRKRKTNNGRKTNKSMKYK